MNTTELITCLRLIICITDNKIMIIFMVCLFSIFLAFLWSGLPSQTKSCADFVEIFVIGLGWGLPSQFLPFRYFLNFFSIVKTHVSYWISRSYLTGVAADQLRGWGWGGGGGGAPVKCKRDSKNVRGIYARSKILLAEKLTNGALVTPPSDQDIQQQKSGHLRRFNSLVTIWWWWEDKYIYSLNHHRKMGDWKHTAHLFYSG